MAPVCGGILWEDYPEPARQAGLAVNELSDGESVPVRSVPAVQGDAISGERQSLGALDLISPCGQADVADADDGEVAVVARPDSVRQ
jgi:hypothetical protein